MQVFSVVITEALQNNKAINSVMHVWEQGEMQSMWLIFAAAAK